METITLVRDIMKDMETLVDRKRVLVRNLEAIVRTQRATIHDLRAQLKTAKSGVNVQPQMSWIDEEVLQLRRTNEQLQHELVSNQQVLDVGKSNVSQEQKASQLIESIELVSETMNIKTETEMALQKRLMNAEIALAARDAEYSKEMNARNEQIRHLNEINAKLKIEIDRLKDEMTRKTKELTNENFETNELRSAVNKLAPPSNILSGNLEDSDRMINAMKEDCETMRTSFQAMKAAMTGIVERKHMQQKSYAALELKLQKAEATIKKLTGAEDKPHDHE